MAHESKTDSKSYLVTLPAELFERVVEYVDAPDLQSLRLVNRDAAAKVLRTYTEVCFATRSICLHRLSSLESAIAAARIEGFNRAIRGVRIYFDPLPGSTSSSQLRLALLTKFFTLLETSPLREIGIALGQMQAGSLPKGITESEFRGAGRVDLHDTQYLSVLENALNATTLVVRQLLIGEGHWTIPISPTNNSDPTTGLGTLTSSVTNLTIGVWTSDRQGLINLAEAISSATQLKSLEIRIVFTDMDRNADYYELTGCRDIEGFMEALAPKCLPELEDLRLDGHRFRIEQLLDFARNQPRLKRIDLFDCVIIDVSRSVKGDGETLAEAVKRITGVSKVVVDPYSEELSDD